MLHHGGRVATLCTNTGHQQGEITDDVAHALELGGLGGSDHEADIGALRPVGGCTSRNPFVQRLGASNVVAVIIVTHYQGILHLVRTGIGGPAQHDDAAVSTRKERFE